MKAAEERSGHRPLLSSRLRAQLAEIEAALLIRVQAIASGSKVADPSYVEGLRFAVRTAIVYALEAIEHGVERLAPPPPALRAQAALAARNGVGLETVLHRYSAGYALLGDYVVGEAAGVGLESRELRAVLRDHAAVFDRIIAAVSEQYAREEHERVASASRRRLDQVIRLLAGERSEAPDLAYELEAWHLGILVSGAEAGASARAMGDRLDRRLLLVSPDPTVCWVWLGGRRRFSAEELEGLHEQQPDSGIVLAFGEPAAGLKGWRMSHRQAAAALPVAVRAEEHTIRYADVALLAAVLQDELYCTSLGQLYLDPLAGDGDGGETLCNTLRAYFAAEQNITSAAAALGVNRNTVSSRLRRAEQRLGRRLASVSAELAIALRLGELS
jgi:hypothetical protein